MKKILAVCAFLTVALISGCKSQDKFEASHNNTLRAPSYPLITIDPYTSLWSFSDALNDEPVKHWTGAAQPLIGAVRVDGEIYRFMGVEETPLKTIIPTADEEKWEGAYTEKAPSGNWMTLEYEDSSWKRANASFGTADMPNLSTLWESSDIWVRRSFDLTEDLTDKTIILDYSHDDLFELYINGVQIVKTPYEWKNNVRKELTIEEKSLLKPGKNVIAAHCFNKVGGGLVDFGLFEKVQGTSFFDNKAIQKSAIVMPTQTFYTFQCGSVDLDIVFTAPLLMNDLKLMTRPVNYISYQVRSNDDAPHDVQIYIEASPSIAANLPSQKMVCGVGDDKNITYAKAGTVEQPILQKKGDDVRIDWGYMYLASAKKSDVSIGIGEYVDIKKRFALDGNIAASTSISDNSVSTLVLGYMNNLGKVSSRKSDFVMIGYDDLYSIQYFNENRMAYWKEDGKVSIIDVLSAADKDYENVMKECRSFDDKMMKDAEEAGGSEYAELCALAYRQSLAAHKLITDKDNNLLFLSKENFSNGSIGTVDITYPSSPLYLLYNPELLKGMMNPIFYYSESGRWNKPFAAHDVGTYPQANGQTYGGDMPVEESGNMLILATAIAMREGNADYAKKHWEVLTTWANYLVKEGLDPENQLCTDDFAGHFAHNANLSIKAIMAIAGYGKLAAMMGDKATSEKYIDIAKDMAAKWKDMAADGDHYKLTFDQSGTWSQKYNLIWDEYFGMNIFDPSIASTEIAYYLNNMQPYGLPLDSRKTYTKSDWITWTACMTDNQDDFLQLISPIYKYANETQTRMPLSDWHETTDASSVGFRARSVVGGYFFKMLEEQNNKR